MDPTQRANINKDRATKEASNLPSTSQESTIKKNLGRWLMSCFDVLIACAIASFLGAFSWILELFCHFRVQYVCLLLIAFLVSLCAKSYLRAGIAAIVCLFCLSTIAPLYWPPLNQSLLDKADLDSHHKTKTYRILVTNLLGSNREHTRVLEMIKAESPDFIWAMEFRTHWQDAFSELATEYPYSKLVPRDDNMGNAFYSRYPLESVEVFPSTQFMLPSLLMQVKLEGQLITIIGTHPLPPGITHRFGARDEQLLDVGNWARKQTGPLMLVGDLNTTQWSPIFTELLRETRLRDSSQGFGVQPTWPTFFVPLQLPIDHVLISPEIEAHKRRVGRSIGSDHYPVILDFSLQSNPEKTSESPMAKKSSAEEEPGI